MSSLMYHFNQVGLNSNNQKSSSSDNSNNNTNITNNNNNNVMNSSNTNNNNITQAMPSCITPSIEGKPLENSTTASADFIHQAQQHRKSSDQSTIPSPPLSPYHRNAELISTKTTLPISLISSSKLFDDQDDEQEQDVKRQDTEHAQRQSPIVRQFTSGEFPVEKLSNRTLSINAWCDVSSGNYKQSHLKFLSNYQIFSNSSNNGRHNISSNGNRVMKKYNTVPRTRRVIHHMTSDVDSGSEFEKIRTRRIVARERGETATPAEQEPPSSIPSTPILKKKPRKPRTETPLSSASPALYVDYESVPDFCPPLTTLPANNTKCLKQDWKGQPMNLSKDPLASKLHPAEVVLASTLRLPCSVYLDSKRRLFLEKVNRTKRNLPFRRTDAQKACKIDVNKASRLFAAFEKVGWLNDSHFQKYARQ